MSHSIPDARAVALHTDARHGAGHRRLQVRPDPGRRPSRPTSRGSRSSAREGVLCLCGDSTNADRPGVAPSESTVGPALLERFSRCEGRIIVTCFASNVHRVQQVIDAAAQLDRRVALVGRSMRKNFNIAPNLGIANAPDGLLIPPKEIEDFPDDKVIAISTGSQGEPLSALRRMAFNDHRDVELHSGDTVIFSATPIPGNERSVNETIDRIFEIGAQVVTAADAPIHVSGHGSQEELKLMLNLTKPRYVFPFHGDHKRIRLHAELAEAVGIDAGAHLQGPQRPGARDRRATARGFGERRPRRDDLRRRRRHRRPRRRRPARPPRCSRPTGSSSSSPRSTPRTAARSRRPEIIFRGVPFLEDADDGLIEELRDVVEDSLAEPRDDGVTRAGAAPAGPPRRHRGVRLRPPAAAADDPAGGGRGLSARPSCAARAARSAMAGDYRARDGACDRDRRRARVGGAERRGRLRSQRRGAAPTRRAELGARRRSRCPAAVWSSATSQRPAVCRSSVPRRSVDDPGAAADAGRRLDRRRARRRRRRRARSRGAGDRPASAPTARAPARPRPGRLGIDPGTGALAWQVSLPSRGRSADFVVLVDARSGETLATRDLLRDATGSATLFDPNPVVEQGSYSGLERRQGHGLDRCSPALRCRSAPADHERPRAASGDLRRRASSARRRSGLPPSARLHRDRRARTSSRR